MYKKKTWKHSERRLRAWKVMILCMHRAMFPIHDEVWIKLGDHFSSEKFNHQLNDIAKWRKTDRLRLRSKHWWEHISVTKWYLKLILSPIDTTKIRVFIATYNFFAKHASCAISHHFFKIMLKWHFTVYMCCIAAKYTHLCFFLVILLLENALKRREIV